MKRAFFPLLATVLSLAALSGCGPKDRGFLPLHRQQFRTLTLKVPGLKGDDCGALLRARLLAENESNQGKQLVFFSNVVFDVSAQTLTLDYNTESTAGWNVLHLVADLGFDCADAADPKRAVTGNPEARKRLPPACR